MLAVTAVQETNGTAVMQGKHSTHSGWSRQGYQHWCSTHICSPLCTRASLVRRLSTRLHRKYGRRGGVKKRAWYEPFTHARIIPRMSETTINRLQSAICDVTLLLNQWLLHIRCTNPVNAGKVLQLFYSSKAKASDVHPACSGRKGCFLWLPTDFVVPRGSTIHI